MRLCVYVHQAVLQVAAALWSQPDLTPSGGEPQLTGGGMGESPCTFREFRLTARLGIQPGYVR